MYLYLFLKPRLCILREAPIQGSLFFFFFVIAGRPTEPPTQGHPQKESEMLIPLKKLWRNKRDSPMCCVPATPSFPTTPYRTRRQNVYLQPLRPCTGQSIRERGPESLALVSTHAKVWIARMQERIYKHTDYVLEPE